MYEFMKKRIVLSKEGKPYKSVWLIIRRSLGPDPTYSFYISNARRTARLTLFVWLSGIRWAIEQCFEEQNRIWEWITTRSENFLVGIAICSLVCSPIFSSGI